MGMTRATFLLVAALVVALVVAAAGMGAYIAVRQIAPAPDAAVDRSVPETTVGAVLHGIDPHAVAGETSSAPGIAVRSTEQVVEPIVGARADRSVLEAPLDRRPPTSQSPPATAQRRAAAPQPAPAPSTSARARRPASRPAPENVRQPAPALVPATVEPELQPEPEPRLEPEPAAPPARRQPTAASRELPEVVGWRPADPAPPTPVRNPARNGAAARNLPPPASASLDPPAPGARAETPSTTFEHFLIPADSVIGLQIDTFVTTDRAEVEDDVQARVTRDVMVSRRVAIPAGSLVDGSVVMVERGGKLGGTARLGVRFHTVVLNDGIEVPIVTETVYREGRSRGRDNAARIGGGAVAGAILGAIFGGGRGAAIGGAAGAAGGTAAAAAGEAEPATLAAGTTLTVRLSRPAGVTVER